MVNHPAFSRRRFIGFGLAASAGIASRARAQSPNSKLNIAIIGVGGRGGDNMGGVSSETIHTLCDVNPGSLAAAKSQHPGAKTTSDWREVMADSSVDAVVISTADHHHAPAALAAMRSGKHVYCEKPLAHTVREARLMQEEYKKAEGRIATQMGTQIHATDNYRRAVEQVRSGVVGQVTAVHVWCGRTIDPIAQAALPGQEVPDGFNWDVWLGPAAAREYNGGYWQGGNLNWNRRWEFGNGVLGDMGSHLIDLPYWALDLDLPFSVRSEGSPPDEIVAPPSQIVTWKHASKAGVHGPAGPAERAALELTWYHGPDGMRTMSERLQPLLGDATNIADWHIGVAFVGEFGCLVADYGRIVLKQNDGFKEPWQPIVAIPASAGHYQEWLKACRGEGEALCNFDYSGRLIEHNLLGNLAHRAAPGVELQWDAAAFKITNHEAANALLDKPYREGWAV
jgi:predicted dehydrogenase